MMMPEKLEQGMLAPALSTATQETPTGDTSSYGVEKRTYSVDDLMEILDLSRSSVYVLIRRNLFKSVKVGKQIRVSKKSFDTWLDSEEMAGDRQ